MKLVNLFEGITSKTVEKEIKKRFGYDVKLINGKGYFYFTDDYLGNDSKVSNWKSTSVYVNSLNQLSLDQWIEEFDSLRQDNEK